MIGWGTLVQAGDFQEQVQKSIDTHYKAVVTEARNLLAQDKLDEANQAWLRAVPDDRLTPADCFVLGNTFFRLDDALSRQYHRRAFEALPEEALTNLEWALSLHRAGRHAEAIPCYQKYASVKPDEFLAHALAADCLVRVGKLQEAVESWKKADHTRNTAGIENAIHEIYGSAKPHKRRADLLKAVHAGNTGMMDALFALSGAWDTDWWTAKPNVPFLLRDIELAAEVLSKEPQHRQELELYASTFIEEVKPEWVKNQLEAGGWILGENGRLPASGKVADRLVSLVLQHRLSDPQALLSRFEKELRRRSLDEGAEDLVALNMLANLLAAAGDARKADLAAVDQLGWDRYHAPQFAGSLLSGEMNQGRLKTDSPAFVRAMKEFPEDESICLLGLQLAHKEGKPVLEPLVTALKAEFRHLSRSSGMIKDSLRLNAMFGELEKKLEEAGK